MERFRKRQRLYSPVRHAYGDQYGYYDEPAGTEGDEEEEEFEETFSDPDAELEEQRARLDFKLKSRFEAIFEKYGKDFDDVGDEIDLATGKILVNNGHLMEMTNELDAGEHLRGREDYSEESTDMEGSSVVDEDDEIEEEEEEEEEGGTDEDELNENDMIEDDIILRGFTQATRFMHTEPDRERFQAPARPMQKGKYPETLRQSVQRTQLPSRKDILAQFGPQLGPDIIKYVSDQNISDKPRLDSAWSVPDLPRTMSRPQESHIEPAWRVPELPAAAPRKRPVLKTAIQPEIERSPSPDANVSLWAPSGTRRRRRRTSEKQPYKSYPIAFSTTDSDAYPLNLPRKKRYAFTVDEDKVMLDWVRKAQQNSSRIPNNLWQELEAKFPHHSSATFRNRYYDKYVYPDSDVIEDSELSTTEISGDRGENMNHFMVKRRSRPDLPESHESTSRIKPVQVSDYQRPVRVRRPAQRDSKIISWTEAVDTIKSLDPDLHAGMRADAKLNLDEGSWAFDRQNKQRREASSSRQGPSLGPSSQAEGQARRRLSDILRNEQQNFGDREAEHTSSAPCPHVECRPYLMKTYRLQRLADEQQSQMSLHLLQVHQTTPFPCGEVECPHKGEHGFFMQKDLISHVKSDHPFKGALKRLRGRVEPHLLEKAVFGDPPSFSSNARPASGYRDSDFMSPQRHFSNTIPPSPRPLSRSSDLDRTLTRHGTAGESINTPMTSVSSLMVNHPSAKVNPMAEMEGGPSRQLEPPTISTGAAEEGHIAQWQNELSPDLGASLRNMSERSTYVPDDRAQIIADEKRRNQELVSPEMTPEPSIEFTNLLRASIPNSQSSLAAVPSSPRQAERSKPPLTRSILPSNVVEQGDMNDLAPEAIAGSTMSPPNQSQQNHPSSEIVTPKRQKKPRKSRKSRTGNIFDWEDADELSLASDGFVLLSAKPRVAKTPLDLPIHIKREETVEPPQTAPRISGKKRKLQDFQGSDELDELMADEPNFFVSHLGPKIKTETEVEAPIDASALSKQAKPKGRPKKSSLSHGLAECPQVPLWKSHSQKSNELVRTGTPLLDLTPSEKRPKSSGQVEEVEEIAESVQDPSSPPAGSMTPLRDKYLSGVERGPAIIVKTPGGTFRKCGEDSFVCKKSFCFRCSSAEEVLLFEEA